MNYCPKCGAQLKSGQNFCTNCGQDVKEPSPPDQGQLLPATTPTRGLGRNNIVFLTREGILGAKLRSDFLLFVAVALPPFVLTLAYYFIQTGALAVYVVVWIAASGLLYDEFRWRGLRTLEGRSPEELETRSGSWKIPWQSIRMADWNGRTLWFSSSNPKRKLSVTFDQADAPLVEGGLASWGIRYSWRGPRLPRTLTRFWTLAFVLFVTSQVILILAAVLPFFPGEEQMYNTILNNTRPEVTNVSFLEAFKAIYLNNIQVAWGGVLPVLGQLSFGLASYNTGRVIQVIAIGGNVPPSIVLVTLYLFPHTWIEESAYPIATAAGLFAVTKWRSVAPGEFAEWANRGSSKLALAMGGVALILLAAGLVETTGLYIGLGEVVFWVPVAIGYYLLVTKNRRRKKHAEATPTTMSGTTPAST